jgi:hypothetical protein
MAITSAVKWMFPEGSSYVGYDEPPKQARVGCPGAAQESLVPLGDIPHLSPWASVDHQLLQTLTQFRFLFVCLAVLGFELRASHWLGRPSTTPPDLQNKFATLRSPGLMICSKALSETRVSRQGCKSAWHA